MSDGEGTRVVIELESGDGPVQGQIIDAKTSPAPFRGWLELLAALEALRTAMAGARDARKESDR